jgi:hypothetical protein
VKMTWWPDQANCPRIFLKIRGAFVGDTSL